MLISYHIKAELCTLFDKVHKAFINSANAPSLCTFYRQQTVCLSADTAAQPVEARLALPGRGMFAMTWRGIAAARRRGGLPGSPGGDKRGRDTKVSLPLLTPQPFLRTRLPPVARLKARGPQGRLLLQEYTLDGSGAFRSDGACALHRLAAHCYARRITQADFRAAMRPKSCPTHGTEPP